jgi:hypothetical protein
MTMINEIAIETALNEIYDEYNKYSELLCEASNLDSEATARAQRNAYLHSWQVVATAVFGLRSDAEPCRITVGALQRPIDDTDKRIEETLDTKPICAEMLMEGYKERDKK